MPAASARPACWPAPLALPSEGFHGRRPCFEFGLRYLGTIKAGRAGACAALCGGGGGGTVPELQLGTQRRIRHLADPCYLDPTLAGCLSPELVLGHVWRHNRCKSPANETTAALHLSHVMARMFQAATADSHRCADSHWQAGQHAHPAASQLWREGREGAYRRGKLQCSAECCTALQQRLLCVRALGTQCSDLFIQRACVPCKCCHVCQHCGRAGKGEQRLQ